MSYRHALQLICDNGGEMNSTGVVIKCQRPKPVRLEQSFPDLKPREIVEINKPIAECPAIEAECAGIIINGRVRCEDNDYVAEVEVSVDGKRPEVMKMPANWTVRKLEVYHNLELKEGHHTITLNWRNPVEGATLNVADVLLLDKE